MYRITTILIIAALTSCFDSKSKQEETNKDETANINSIIKLQVDNKDINKLGLQLYNDDESVGVKSIWLDLNNLYLVDTYHSNIKCINLNNHEVEVSPLLRGSNRSWLRDIFIVENRIYVLSDLGVNYILSNDLVILDTFLLDPCNMFFVRYNNDTITLTSNGKNFLNLNKEGEVLSKVQDDYINVLKLAHYKSYELVETADSSTIVKTNYGNVKINGKFPYIWEYYDGINIDFNSNNLVYLEIVENNYVIHIKQYD